MHYKPWIPTMNVVVEFKLIILEREKLDATRLGHMRGISLIPCDKYFLNALMECWCDETNTFHLLMGEIMIILDDIHHILWVPWRVH